MSVSQSIQSGSQSEELNDDRKTNKRVYSETNIPGMSVGRKKGRRGRNERTNERLKKDE